MEVVLRLVDQAKRAEQGSVIALRRLKAGESVMGPIPRRQHVTIMRVQVKNIKYLTVYSARIK